MNDEKKLCGDAVMESYLRALGLSEALDEG